MPHGSGRRRRGGAGAKGGDAPRAPLALAVALAVALLAPAGAGAAATLTPATVDVTLRPDEAFLEQKLLDVPARRDVPVDVVFMIDSTGSMGPAIDQLRAELREILDRLVADFPDLRVGLVDHRDHPGTYTTTPHCSYSNLYGSSSDRCWMSHVPLTDQLGPTGPVVLGFDAIVAADGGDFPECHAAVLQRLVDDPANAIGWRPGSVRLVVALTDTYAHDCDFCAIRPGGCPGDFLTSPPGMNGVDPGLDGRVSTNAYPDDAPLLATVDRMIGGGLHAKIKLGMIFVRTFDLSDPLWSDEIGTPFDPAEPPGAWRLYCQRTRGDARSVDGDGRPPLGVDLGDFVESLVIDIAASCAVVTADVSDPAYAGWIQVDGQPVPHVLGTALRPSFQVPFQVTIRPPAAATAGRHSFELRTHCDGDFLAAQGISVDVVPCQAGAPDVTANSLRAARVLPAGGRFEWGSSGTGGWNLHATGDPAAIPGLWADAATRVTAVAVTAADDDGSFPLGYYQVYGADGCTGASVP